MVNKSSKNKIEVKTDIIYNTEEEKMHIENKITNMNNDLPLFLTMAIYKEVKFNG